MPATRTPSLFGDDRSAILSVDRRYRYVLRRVLRPGGGRVCLFIMLNPSTADENEDDPTIRACTAMAVGWGYDELRVVNLFALRATQPSELVAHSAPVGAYNDAHILSEALGASLLVCAWGQHGGHMGRDRAVEAQLRSVGVALHCLAHNADGTPRHPLYVRRTTIPTPWAPLAVDSGHG